MLAGSNTHRLGMFASLVFIASTRRSAMHPYGLSLVSNKHSNSAFVIALRSVQPCSQTSHVHMGSQPLSQFLSGLALTGLLAAASAGLIRKFSITKTGVLFSLFLPPTTLGFTTPLVSYNNSTYSRADKIQ